VSNDSQLFKTLLNTWAFKQTPDGCLIDFKIAFEFSSPLYSRMAGMFFKDVAQNTLSAFNKRCLVVYGPPKETKKKG